MKRLISILLALMLLVMLGVPAASAETTDPDYIYFQVPYESGVKWANFSMIFCHIWQNGGDPIFGWQDKNERCEDVGGGYWRYDISGIDFDPALSYAVIFSNENGMQTYDLYITSACRGDVAYCAGDTCVNPVDSEKDCAVARWMNAAEIVPPVPETGSDGNLLNPDGVDPDTLSVLWGESDGISFDLPEVSSADADDQGAEVADDADDGDDGDAVTLTSDNSASSPVSAVSTWIIIVCAVLAVAIIVIVVILARRNRKPKSDD